MTFSTLSFLSMHNVLFVCVSIFRYSLLNTVGTLSPRRLPLHRSVTYLLFQRNVRCICTGIVQRNVTLQIPRQINLRPVHY
jgi:hypothetical protein